jgi:O-antigen/teichoic acid export membrane protein
MEIHIGAFLRESVNINGLRFQHLVNTTLTQGAWMLVATGSSGLLNYIANVTVGRLLGPADYSTYAAMLSLTLILGAITSIVQTLTTNYVTQLRSTNRETEVGELLIFLIKKFSGWGIIGVLVLCLFSGSIASLLNISSPYLVMIMGFTLLPCMVLPVFQGGARGMERYFVFGNTQIAMALFRLIFGIVLISIGLGVTGAVASLPLYFIFSISIAFWGIHDLFNVPKSGSHFYVGEILKYMTYISAGMIAYTLMSNVDIMVVKSRFVAEEAGLYSAVATIGKISLYLPAAVATLLLPKVAMQHALHKKTLSMLYYSLLIVGFICLSVTTVFFLYPQTIVRLLFGTQYLKEAGLLANYGVAMTLYALCNIFLAYFLALQKKTYSYILLAIAIVQTLLLCFLPIDINQVVSIMILCGFFANIFGLIILFKPLTGIKRLKVFSELQ